MTSRAAFDVDFLFINAYRYRHTSNETFRDGCLAEIDAETFSARQEVKRLLDPDGMGSDLKVLVQGRGGISDVACELLAGPGRESSPG